MSKLLKTTGRILAEHKFRYLASTRDCGSCPLKSKCCPNTPQRMITRDVNEDAVRYASNSDRIHARNKPSRCATSGLLYRSKTDPILRPPSPYMSIMCLDAGG